MDNKKAKDLLAKLKQEKQAEITPDSLIKDYENTKALKQIAKMMLVGGGIGAGLRGASGLYNLFAKDKEITPLRTIDLDVPVRSDEEKTAGKRGLWDNVHAKRKRGEKPAKKGDKDYPDEKSWKKTTKEAYEAGSPWNSDYMIPGMMLGTPLAAYGGWKAIDKILNYNKKQKSKSELEAAKAEYEEAIQAAFKQGSDEANLDGMLEGVYEEHYKKADFGDILRTGKGLYSTYALASAPLAFMMVNSAMKKNSKKKLIEKAMRERARRKSQQQPQELYAKPKLLEE